MGPAASYRCADKAWDHDEQSTMRAGTSVNVVGSQVAMDDVDIDLEIPSGS